jgi:uncharacterized phage-associated protein
VAGGIDFNRGKFKELVAYLSLVAEREGDEGFGMVKLNKLLYRADFEAYRLLGRSITGETYEKQAWGPVARDLPIVLDELAADGRLYWQHIPRGPYTRDVPTTREDDYAFPDMSMFPKDERKVIEKTLHELATYGGKEVSDWSHEESAGWKSAPKDGDAIKYGSAFISTEPIPEEDLERAKQYVRDQGWVKDAAG